MFHKGGSRKEFLATCKKTLAEYPGSRHDEELKSLIAPLEREAAAPRPAFLQKDQKERAEEEQIRFCIWQLRDLAVEQETSPGYRPADSQAEREAAIAKAKAGWAADGRKELAAKVAADHPPVVDPGDLFRSDDEIALRVSAIQGSDREKRTKTIASPRRRRSSIMGAASGQATRWTIRTP